MTLHSQLTGNDYNPCLLIEYKLISSGIDKIRWALCKHCIKQILQSDRRQGEDSCDGGGGQDVV